MDRELRVSIDRLCGSIDALRETIENQRSAAADGPPPDDLRAKLEVLAGLMRDDLISEDEYSERKDGLMRPYFG